ncbi:hypothetical protein IWQ60_003754 [Tieghemiomyces parasiticus]|uniref:Swiss Army Knife 2H phosphoesterase domain-containing protein n=1 Tax=Tieghemiomyces parasiticus TaxID=78921 RepID=A0A9W8DZR6_9FUNG|nr:hypothetical protein IWQ60_003754 [Tieghemiomyces parasiticus]
MSVPRLTIHVLSGLLLTACLFLRPAQGQLPEQNVLALPSYPIPQPDSPGFTLPAAALNTTAIPYESHGGPGPNDTWLQHTLNAALLTPLRQAVEAAHGQPLLNRGEAHVTLITPPEYHNVLAPAGVTLTDLDDIARAAQVQAAPIQALCVGRQRLVVTASPQLKDGGDTTTMYAYNLIVRSPTWTRIRWQVWRRFIGLGGEPSLFDPEANWPHVTLGFSHRDLFLQDGVFKGINSCWRAVTVVE